MPSGILQLFHTEPPPELVEAYARCLGLAGVHDTRPFTKHHLLHNGARCRVEAMLEQLSSVYIPCKQHYVLRPLTPRTLVSILRQLLRGRQSTHCVHVRDRNMNNTKVLQYQILPAGQEPQTRTLTRRQGRLTVSFA